jgi:hypothetical protein
MLSCSNWVTPINDAAALRACGDNARPSRALPEAPNRCRVNEGWSPCRVLKHTPRSWLEAKVNARRSLDTVHDSTRRYLLPHCQHRRSPDTAVPDDMTNTSISAFGSPWELTTLIEKRGTTRSRPRRATAKSGSGDCSTCDQEVHAPPPSGLPRCFHPAIALRPRGHNRGTPAPPG